MTFLATGSVVVFARVVAVVSVVAEAVELVTTAWITDFGEDVTLSPGASVGRDALAEKDELDADDPQGSGVEARTRVMELVETPPVKHGKGKGQEGQMTHPYKRGSLIT